MDNKVVITAFSGENRLSSREVSVDDYYDGQHPEFEDRDYISEHGIDRAEIVIDAYGEHKEYTNHYDEYGRLCRSESNENGKLSEDLIEYREGRIVYEEHINYDENGIPHSEKKIYN